MTQGQLETLNLAPSITLNQNLLQRELPVTELDRLDPLRRAWRKALIEINVPNFLKVLIEIQHILINFSLRINDI